MKIEKLYWGIMALIENDSPALTGGSQQYWLDMLNNRKILEFNLEKAINALQKKEVHSYTIDTGQDHYTVQRHDLPQLYMQLSRLTKEIEELEMKTGTGPYVEKSHQVVPGW
ncbi:hypothetical protein AGMMS49944_15770 [Spirochaetia bacterium]|nr:hypothetical protein AGMMS49944_15770 [Spirochaetia bacterium]